MLHKRDARVHPPLELLDLPPIDIPLESNVMKLVLELKAFSKFFARAYGHSSIKRWKRAK